MPEIARSSPEQPLGSVQPPEAVWHACRGMSSAALRAHGQNDMLGALSRNIHSTPPIECPSAQTLATSRQEGPHNLP
eukprot:2217270-Alexandrium_andersonii.AAC.1